MSYIGFGFYTKCISPVSNSSSNNNLLESNLKGQIIGNTLFQNTVTISSSWSSKHSSRQDYLLYMGRDRVTCVKTCIFSNNIIFNCCVCVATSQT